MATGKILDSAALRLGWASFRTARVLDDGRSILIAFEAGGAYRVEVGYLLKWGLPVRPGAGGGAGMRRISKARCASGRQRLFVYLDDGSRFEVPWDTVLMACEPRYEHYGGLTEASRQLVKTWARRRSQERE